MSRPTDRDLIQQRTREHYDRFPFGFIAEAAAAEDIQPAPFRQFVAQYLRPADKVLDAGCGPGRGLLYLENAGQSAIGCDLSERSLAIAAQRLQNPRLVKGSCLRLPFSGPTFDAIICDGVLHHTPDACAGFRELCRVLKPGGRMYIAVYKRWRYYYYLYRYLGGVIRWLDKSAVGRAVISATLLPLYHLAHLVKSRGRRTWGGSRNLFYDYFVTPRATFHTRAEVMSWGEAQHLRLLEYHPFPRGNCHMFVFEASA